MTLLVHTFPPTDCTCFLRSELGLQSTPDSSNLLGKSKKVRVSGSLSDRELSGENSRKKEKKQMNGEGEIDWYFEKGIKLQSLSNIIGMDTEFELEGQKSKDKTLPRFNYNMVPVIEGKFT